MTTNSITGNDQAFTARTPRVSAAIALHRAAKRKKSGRFVVEGFNCVDAAIRSDAVVEIFATASAVEKYAELLGRAAQDGIEISLVDNHAAEMLSETVTTAGLFAVCDATVVSTDLDVSLAVAKQAGCLVIAVECADPGNAGTIIRMTDALRAGAVLFVGDAVDPLSAKVARASAGSVFHTAVVRERNLFEVLKRVRAEGFTTLATSMNGNLTLGRDALPEQPIAWLFGNEAHGLSQESLDAADQTVAIPIRGAAESLNLATAAAMCLWETVRGK